MRNKNNSGLTTGILALIALAAVTVGTYIGFQHLSATATWCGTHPGHALYCSAPSFIVESMGYWWVLLLWVLLPVLAPLGSALLHALRAALQMRQQRLR